MNRTLLLAGGALALAGGAIALWVVRGRSDGPGHERTEPKQHQVLPTVKAMLDAPDGETPCESAYVAAAAEQERARSIGKDSMFSWVAPRDQFIARCSALTAQQQRCMVPTYLMANRDQCERVRPEAAVLDGIVKSSAGELHEAEPPIPPPAGAQPAGSATSAGPG